MLVWPILRIWMTGFVCAMIVSALVYATMPPAQDDLFGQAILWVLLPGIALWFQAGGSLFGGGFGTTLDFVIIAGGSALAWSIPFPFLVRGIAWLRQR